MTAFPYIQCRGIGGSMSTDRNLLIAGRSADLATHITLTLVVETPRRRICTGPHFYWRCIYLIEFS